MASKRRSTHAQMEAMRRLWPQMKGERKDNGLVVWAGLLKPRAKIYQIAIYWWPGHFDPPYSLVVHPPIEPLAGGTYEQIPHLIFNPDCPERSRLCLFDPDGQEWSPMDLIAETTVKWTSEWLHYYELWHLTGEWLGPSVGYESIAAMRLAEAQSIREALQDVY
jgi:hypothetical protein